MHAAVIAINEAIDRGQASVTMGALNNPNAMLKNTDEALAQHYQDTLSQAKDRKQNQSSGRVSSLTDTDVMLYVRFILWQHTWSEFVWWNLSSLFFLLAYS